MFCDKTRRPTNGAASPDFWGSSDLGAGKLCLKIIFPIFDFVSWSSLLR
jgi:hypothetical protein